MNDDLHQQRISILEGRVDQEYLEGLTETTDNQDSGSNELVEALSEYDEQTLSDREALQAEAERLEQKLDAVGSVLPADRVREVETHIEALQGAADVTNRFLNNSPEALAGRINQ